MTMCLGVLFVPNLNIDHSDNLKLHMLRLSHIYIYPVKSLGGISLQRVQVQERGLEHDRRWLVVDETGRFQSQREFPQMALIEVQLTESGLLISHRDHASDALRVPFFPETLDTVQVTVWNDTIEAVVVNETANTWFSKVLGKPLRLVFLPDSSPRPADANYAPFEANVSFADGYPYLLVGQASLDDLNTRLEKSVEVARFRPNLVVTGSLPYDEDHWFEFRVGAQDFVGVKPCARCIMTTVNPTTGQFEGKEPVRTLSTYRKRNNKIFFGQNVMTAYEGIIAVGDEVTVQSRKVRQTMSETPTE
jgi:uncharacterized protein